MKCIHCGKPGYRVGTWISKPYKRNRWAVFECQTASCAFEFDTLAYPGDPSIKKRAKPRWMLPERELA